MEATTNKTLNYSINLDELRNLGCKEFEVCKLLKDRTKNMSRVEGFSYENIRT